MTQSTAEKHLFIAMTVGLLTWAGCGACQSRAGVVDFEDLPLSAGQYWNGSDLAGGFTSRGAWFSNNYNTNWFSWDGFAYSSVNDTNTPGFGNQYAVLGGTGMGGTGNYAVAYCSAWAEQPYVRLGAPSEVSGFYVNNTTYAGLIVLNGDSSWGIERFGGPSGNEPDWFLLTVTGKDFLGRVVGTVDFYLADYRFADNTNDYVISDWTWVDLTSLGNAVTDLHFSMNSSDVDPVYGMNTPAFFAMDGLDYTNSHPFSRPRGDGSNPFDPGIPGFVGPDGDGIAGGSNSVNPLFVGWASEVVSYSPAPGVDADWTNPTRVLGQVSGSNFNIVALGELSQAQIDGGVPPGQLVLGFGMPIGNGPGADFAVFENGSPGGDENAVNGELAYVEVSTDGSNFARFPCVSLNELVEDPGDPNVRGYRTIDARDVHNLCGKHANAYGSSWGTPFDLRDLAQHPLVTGGVVDLNGIHYVRIVDIPGSGDYFDDLAPPNPIYDMWETWGSGGADIEAVGVVNRSRTLVVESSYGMSTWREGTNYCVDASTISAAVTNSPWEANGTQHVCVGWTGTGSVPGNGVTGDTGPFDISKDSGIRWLWETNYRFEISVDVGGDVGTTSGWYAPGSELTSTVTVHQFYHFAGWAGDTEGDTNAVVMGVALDRPRSITCNVEPDLATNGVSIPWLVHHNLTNGFDVEAMSDRDLDGEPAWREYFAGTDPDNGGSLFRIVDQGVAGGSNYVAWLGGTNGSPLPFTVYMMTNLLAEWELVDGLVERSGSGTNVWWNTNHVDGAFFRIGVATGKE